MADHSDAGGPRRVLRRHDWHGHSVEVAADLEPEVGQLDERVDGEDGEEEAQVFVLPEIF